MEQTVTITDAMISDEAWDCAARREAGVVKAIITELYGSRCHDFDEDCVLCRKWKAFDELFGEVS